MVFFSRGVYLEIESQKTQNAETTRKREREKEREKEREEEEEEEEEEMEMQTGQRDPGRAALGSATIGLCDPL